MSLLRSRSSQEHPIARALGRGLAAGLGGTAVMTGVQMVKAKLGDEEPSMAPAKAAEKTLGMKPRSEKGERALNHAVHWGYGTAWGLARSLLARAGLRGIAASSLHLGVLWGTALVMLPRMGLSESPRKWGAKVLASDLAQHAVYAFAAGFIYDRLARRAA